MPDSNRRTCGAAFLDGFSIAGLLTPLNRPGAPTQLFADPASPSMQDRCSATSGYRDFECLLATIDTVIIARTNKSK